MQLASNPALMQQQMRQNDQAMNNIQSHPEGFNALRNMYQNLQVHSFLVFDVMGGWHYMGSSQLVQVGMTPGRCLYYSSVRPVKTLRKCPRGLLYGDSFAEKQFCLPVASSVGLHGRLQTHHKFC